MSDRDCHDCPALKECLSALKEGATNDTAIAAGLRELTNVLYKIVLPLVFVASGANLAGEYVLSRYTEEPHVGTYEAHPNP